MVLKRVGVLSLGKLSGLMYGVIGLIAGVLFAFFSLIGAAFSRGFGDEGGPILGMIFGVGAIIAMPLFYGVMGFIGGIIMGGLYNLSAKALGGVEVEFGEPSSPRVMSETTGVTPPA